MNVSRSGFYQRQVQPLTAKEIADQVLTDTIRRVWADSRHSYGSRRVHAELRLGRNIACGRQRVERLMRNAQIQGIYRRRHRGCTIRDNTQTGFPDRVNRAFHPDRADRLWCMDITEHPTPQGKVYLAVVIDAYSRRVIGWSIADHMKATLVSDALDMATTRRRPAPGSTVAHSDHGAQGGIKGSSQRLDMEVEDGATAGMDGDADGKAGDAVAGQAADSSGGGAGVLAQGR